MEHHGIKAYMLQWMEEHKEEIYTLSDDMWEYPELGLEEYEASAKMTEILEKYGFEVRKGIGGLPTAFIATYGSGSPTAGINVEYGLPAGIVPEEGFGCAGPCDQGGAWAGVRS